MVNIIVVESPDTALKVNILVNPSVKAWGQYPYFRYIYIKSLSRDYKTLQRARFVSPSDKFIKEHELKSKSLCQKQCMPVINQERRILQGNWRTRETKTTTVSFELYRSRLKSFVKYSNERVHQDKQTLLWKFANIDIDKTLIFLMICLL